MNFEELVKPKGTDTGPNGQRGRGLAVGGLPSVSLLPPELKNAERDRTIRRILIYVLAAVLGLTAGAVALAIMYSSTAQTRFDAETARSQALAQQIAKFGPVSKLQQQIALGSAAVKVGSSTQIDWQEQFAALVQYMPEGFTVTSIAADSASVSTDYPQGGTPLELPRAATVVLTADSTTLDGVPHWLRMIRQIPSYADATASVTHDDENGYSIKITAHLSAKAIEKDAYKEWVK